MSDFFRGNSTVNTLGDLEQRLVLFGRVAMAAEACAAACAAAAPAYAAACAAAAVRCPVDRPFLCIGCHVGLGMSAMNLGQPGFSWPATL